MLTFEMLFPAGFAVLSNKELAVDIKVKTTSTDKQMRQATGTQVEEKKRITQEEDTHHPKGAINGVSDC